MRLYSPLCHHSTHYLFVRNKITNRNYEVNFKYTSFVPACFKLEAQAVLLFQSLGKEGRQGEVILSCCPDVHGDVVDRVALRM